MKQDEIIEMARQVGLCRTQYNFDDWIDAWPSTLELVEFAKLVAAAEREACAQICFELASHNDMHDGAQACFEAIRARGEA